MKSKTCFIAFGLILFGHSGTLVAATGGVSGTVRDADTDKPLPGANVTLEGTAFGAAANQDGVYFLSRIPTGDYTLIVSYIGYRRISIPVTVEAGRTTQQDVALVFEVVEGREVVVTAQLEGQARAINLQLTSNTITNVVSAERIQELPDANAAESVGRLPGISIKRSGGEGNKIVIRGLAPTYNVITVGGEKVPATDLDDRSVDLAMISPEILAGIEVTKALTPDKDADSFGGIVNFQLADAPEGFRSNIRVQSGYNALRQEPGQYKGSVTLSNRYWNDRLGIMATGNIDRKQRGTDKFRASYGYDNFWEKLSVSGATLEHVMEVRKRKGGSLLMDYQLTHGKLLFSNFMSRLDRNEVIRYNQFSESSNWHERRFRERNRQIDILSNSLTGEHDLLFGKIDWRLSRTASLTRHPYDSYIRTKERGGFDAAQFGGPHGPDVLIDAAYNDMEETHLYAGIFYSELQEETDLSSQFNVIIPYTLTRKLAGYVKFGGKYLNKSKVRDSGYSTRRLDYYSPKSNLIRHHTHYDNPDYPDFEYQTVPTGAYPSIYNYLDTDFDAGSFLGGDYDFGPGLDRNELNHLVRTFLLDSAYSVNSNADFDDFETIEEVSAGYIMTEINLGRFLMFLPGVRYEYTLAHMTGREGVVPSGEVEPEIDEPFITDTTATASWGRWFPMYHLRIRPTNWFDIRLAYTRTLSRPRLSWMLPNKKVRGEAMVVEYGRPDLQPQISTNYDVFLSFYSNRIGLLTIGGFYKEIDSLIFEREGHKILDWEKEGFPKELQGYWLDRPENSPFKTEVIGYEVEWQTNFHWLPSPFDGLVLNVNYAHVRSETRFPRSFVQTEPIPMFPFIKTAVVDSFRVGDMPDQADDIANLAIGYDKGPFSARLSMLYQGSTLSSVAERPEMDGFTADLVRWDLSVKYRLTDHIGLFYNLNNFTNRPDESFRYKTRYPTRREYYGWTTDLGIGFTF
ncbi:MAG: TonB-dependent receptor [Fidelibacterota bacterium]|nr:MAG: TonB-dependent receptor [Candidatus Neomarinimicrobiota bacterium]